MKPTDRIFLFKECHRILPRQELTQWKIDIASGNYEVNLDRLSYHVAKALLSRQRKLGSMN